MDVKVLFNSESIRKDLSAGWGLSFLIDNRIIFDTGGKGDYLLNNINKLEIDISLIEDIVISHDHWDHPGGLWDILAKTSDINVFSSSGFGSVFKRKILESSAKLKEVTHFMRVNIGVYSSGEIVGTYKGKNISEQSLIVKTEKGFSVITGCAHPGIIKILEKVKSQLSIKKFYAVLGGFHLKNHSNKEIKQIVEEFVKLKVNKVGATHCSGIDAENIFKEKYRDNFLDMKAGQVITV
ncbi:MAG: MBL fold metallo-hydrolase [Candidatus Zapsychrus exili]|nr:MBL fold metallo-hydrolase [Candidatus Zapsychrus exili]